MLRWAQRSVPGPRGGSGEVRERGCRSLAGVRIEKRSGYVLVEGGPVPKRASAITLGRVVIVRTGHADSPYLLRHELVHVRQWRRYGVFGFLRRYLGSYVLWRTRRKGHRGAYLRIPFEVEADWLARRMVATAAERAATPTSV
jgi:Domain of unknown function (DUF4157)